MSGSQSPRSNYSFNGDNGLIQLCYLLLRVRPLLAKPLQRTD
jgi:hypothetical protein